MALPACARGALLCPHSKQSFGFDVERVKLLAHGAVREDCWLHCEVDGAGDTAVVADIGRPVCFCGHSLGALVGLSQGIFPDRVASVVHDFLQAGEGAGS